MQCPMPVNGAECGERALSTACTGQESPIGAGYHFECEQGHRFHVLASRRWQTCASRHAGTDLDTTALLQSLAAQKGIRVIMM